VCIIIDVNVAPRVLLQEDPEFEPVSSRLLGNAKPQLRITYGGLLQRELFENSEIRLVLRELDSAGRAKVVPDQRISEEEETVSNLDLCVSDDLHIIALARAASARVLISLDQDLHRDFTNPRILNNPRGKVYQNRQHAKLLNKPCNMPKR
jgi:hypothetical protein